MIYLIGGITCSGKTTLAQKLNTLYNIEVYKVDDDIIKFADETDVCKDIGSPLDYIFSLDIRDLFIKSERKNYESIICSQ